jgi:hypothetical protein
MDGKVEIIYSFLFVNCLRFDFIKFRLFLLYNENQIESQRHQEKSLQ